MSIQELVKKYKEEKCKNCNLENCEGININIKGEAICHTKEKAN